MLEQQGINVATVGIIPVKLDIDYKKDNSGNDNLSQIDNLSNVYIDSDNIIVNPSNTIGKYYDRVREIIPIRRLTDSFDIIKTIEEPMSKFFPSDLYLQKFKERTQTLSFIKKKLFNILVLLTLKQAMENIDSEMNIKLKILQKVNENMPKQKKSLIKS